MSASFSPMAFPNFDKILQDIEFGIVAQASSMPANLRALLPSVCFGNNKPQAAPTLNRQYEGPAKKKQAVAEHSTERINQDFDPDLEVSPLQFNKVFPQACRQHAPKGKEHGQSKQLCLEYFTSGKCTFHGCKFAHGRLSKATKKELKEFVQGRLAVAAEGS